MPNKSTYSLGIDIGGTFTDLVLFDLQGGAVVSYKELTTPHEPTVGVIAGVRRLLERERIPIQAVRRIVHATTLFTNCLIERKGALTGLLTTEGFRDVLEIGHERKFELYDLNIEKPRPLVSRELRAEVRERIGPDGSVRTALDADSLLRSAGTLVDKGVRSIAIVFLHAYLNDAHERQARELLAGRFPDLYVSISSEISPQIREFERTSTTVANAYIQPLADRYIERLGRELRELGASAELFLMLSNGGLTNIAEAKRKPIEMLESGPAAGALSGAHFAALGALPNVLAFDMGGTTAKLCVVDDCKPLIAYEFEAAREKRFIEGSGLPIRISTVELIEIGAGGGSIARRDQLGLLRVGPDSAGSDPGPACYSRGGADPTVTDANLILGYLDPAYFAGGTMAIDTEKARGVLQVLGEQTRLESTQAAWGIHNIVNEGMASAARVHLAELGKDPRKYALLTTGGGGPLHGCEVARKIGIDQVLCPPSAGVASAIGLLVAPARVDRVATVATPLDQVNWAELESTFTRLESDARAIVLDSGVDSERVVVTRLAEMRYVGQGFEIVVELPAGPYSIATGEPILQRFEEQYAQVFGRTPQGVFAEFVNVRVSAQAAIDDSAARGVPPTAGHSRDARKGHRSVYFGGVRAYLDTPVLDRKLLLPGTRLSGPAVIEEAESTLILPPDAQATVEWNGSILITLNSNSQAGAEDIVTRGADAPAKALEGA